jgi:23S rRNA (cytosine1962-C5)-methyltransferase
LHTPQKGPSSIAVNGGVHAEATLRVLTRRNGRALVELSPQTGRRHQLRVQLAHRRCPIVGDTLYGGQPGLRLMLHATSLELPQLNLRFEAPPPAEFQSWSHTEGLGESARIQQALTDAACRRAFLFGSTHTAFRLANEKGDGLPGVRLDRYDDYAVLELTSAESQARRQELAQLVHAMGALGVYVKCRLRADLRNQETETLAPRHPAVGQVAPDPMVVSEEGLRFEVSLGDGWDTGLYTDQRANRVRIRACAEGKRVLNLFCYSGSFTAAAARGGALTTTSVDISRRALARAQRNLQLNGIEPGTAHRLLRADAVDFMRRAIARGETYDLIILDPPSFSTTGKKRVFRLESAWPTLIEAAIALLSPGGECLFVTHEVPARAARLRHRLKEACGRLGRTATVLRDLPSGSDCPDQPEGPCPSRSVWLRVA